MCVSVTLVHCTSTLLAHNGTAPVELALAILCLPLSPEAPSTAEHITATSSGAVGALTAPSAQRTGGPVSGAEVGRPFAVDNVLALRCPRAHVLGHEALSAVVCDHLNGTVKLELQSIAH